MTTGLDSPKLRTLETSVADGVALLVLDRPPSNALTDDLLADLLEALAWVERERSIRAVVITGAGRAFSTGGDLEVIRDALTDPDSDPVAQVDRSLGLLADLVLRVRALRKPVVAAVNGQAAGAGFSLALACDFRVAAQRAALNFAYGALGTSPDGGMTWLLPRLVPPGRAVQLLMEQPVLRAPAALAEGLVDEVVAPDELVPAATERARRLGQRAPHALRAARELVATSMELSLPAQLDRERELFAEAVRTNDFRGGVVATLEGRRPTFDGT